MSTEEKSKTKICKYCKTEIPADAKICPNCRKKQGPGGCLIAVIVVVVLLILIGVFAGGGNDEVTKVETTAQESIGSEEASPDETEAEVESSAEDMVFAVGETAQQNDIQVTLVSATESSGGNFITPDNGNVFLLLEFNIVNNSSKDINISSMLNFEAYCDDYSVTQDLTALMIPEAEGKSQLDGSIAAGKKMSGIIGYQVPADYSEFEVTVAPDFWATKDITFVVTK